MLGELIRYRVKRRGSCHNKEISGSVAGKNTLIVILYVSQFTSATNLPDQRLLVRKVIGR